MSSSLEIENVGLAAWINAFSPDPWIFKGLQVRDLTLGHATLLQRFELNEPRNVADLINALRIISKDYKGGLEYIDSLFWDWRLIFHPKRLWKYLKTRVANVWLYLQLKDCPESTFEQLMAYLDWRTTTPPIGQIIANPRNIPDLGFPFLGQLRGTCVIYGGYDPETIMDQGFLQLAYDYMMIMGVSPTNEKDRAIGEALKSLPTNDDRTKEALERFK